MTAKPFDQKLYDANDGAKHIVIEWLNQNGYDAGVNPDKYAIDVVGVNKETGVTTLFEVEVKHNWYGPQFPFDSLHIAARKLRTATPSCMFVVLNSQKTHMFMVKGSVVMASPIVVKDTYLTTNEEFIEIPVEKCERIKLNLNNGEQK